MASRKRRPERTAARKEDIVRKAAEAFSEHGYDATTIEAIATKLNLTKGSIYYYVPGKQALLFEAHRFAMGLLLRGIKQISESKEPPRVKLEHAIRYHIDAVIDELSLATVLLQQEFALSADQRGAIIELRDDYERVFRSVIRAGVAGGVFKGVDVRITSFAILGAVNWMPHWFSHSGPLSKKAIADIITEYMVGGLLVEETASNSLASRRLSESFGVKDRVVVVTGAGSGIGRAVSRGLADCGARVALVDREASAVAEAAIAARGRSGDVESFAVDVTRATEVAGLRDAITRRFGRIDGLVHAAGVATRVPVLEMDEAQWDYVVGTNLKGSFLVCQEMARSMIEHGDGEIVLFSSVVAKTGGQKGFVHYAASKGGVEAMTRTLSLELAPHGIRVNAVAPGLTETPMTETTVAKDHLDKMQKVIPLRRLAQPEDYIGPVMFLLSRASGYVTGQILAVDGGLAKG